MSMGKSLMLVWIWRIRGSLFVEKSRMSMKGQTGQKSTTGATGPEFGIVRGYVRTGTVTV
jgi:hypothetical protein